MADDPLNQRRIDLQRALTKGKHKESFAPAQLKVDQTGIGAHASVVTVGSVAEDDILIGDITTEGWLFLENLDPVNFVTYGPNDTTMTAFGRIEAGEFACLRLEPGVTLRAQADTAPVQIKVLLLED